MARIRLLVVAGVLVALALLASACAGGSPPPPQPSFGGAPGTVRVGSTDFTEQLILANMYADVLEASGFTVERRLNLGSREIVFTALTNGEIDLLPEYVGALLAFVSPEEVVSTDTGELVARLRAQLARKRTGLVALEPSPAQDRDALVVTRETAERYDLQTVSDLAPVAGELVVGGPPEMEQRRVGLPGLRDVYGIQFKDFRPLDAGGPLTWAALEKGDIQVARMFTTQGIIAEKGWVVLEEDKPLVPAENIIPVIRAEVLTHQVAEILNDLSVAITTDDLTELNKLVDVDKEDPELVAHQWLSEHGFLSEE
ncbi:MAG: ABC transporter substrate-binding protein [Actinomycetota bacterium]|nr:ABC transporter substrate-binding protein [Actinomycetota bacterium]